MFGQLSHFAVHDDARDKHAIERYVSQVERLLDVLDKRLDASAHLADDSFTIADIATYPRVRAAVDRFGDVPPRPLETRPALARWLENVGARPAVQRGMNVPPST